MLSAVEIAELTQELAIDKGLNAMGLDLSKDEFYDRYGRTPPEDDNDKLPGQPPNPPSQGGNMTTKAEDPALKMSSGIQQVATAPAAGVAGVGEFRGYSEKWQRYITEG